MATSMSEWASQRTVEASEFEAECLNLMDEVAKTGGAIVITRRGKPVAKLTAFSERPESLYGLGRGRMNITGDIISPIDVEWEAISNPDGVLNPC